MKKSIIVLAVAAAMLLHISGCGRREIPEGTSVTFVYSSDVHGRLEGCGCKKNGGGITRRAAQINALRNRNDALAYCDAGNFLTGTKEADDAKGKLSVAVYNQLQTAAVNLSERELAAGIEAFKTAKKDAKFDFVSANVRYHGSPLVSPFVIKLVQEVRVAFIGLCGTPNVMRYDSLLLPQGVEIANPLSEVKKVVAAVAGKADVIVVLSSCGDAVDSALASKYPDIDLIVGGRSFKPNEQSPWVIGKTRIVRAHHDGKTVGRLDVIFGSQGQIKSYNSELVALETNVPGDAAMLTLVRQYVPNFTDNPSEGSSAH
jgi:5'-nucleotidase / UDP-sugar diphosphatase